MELKDKFYQIYANLPLDIREEVILVIDDEPVTWQVAKLEIDNSTQMGQQILEKLNSLEVI